MGSTQGKSVELKTGRWNHKDLHVYQTGIVAAMQVFETTKAFPAAEQHALVDEIRRSSRCVCTNLAAAWRKRRYQASFLATLNDAESEAAKTQVWIALAKRCRYLDVRTCDELDKVYDMIIAQIESMIDEPERWLLR